MKEKWIESDSEVGSWIISIKNKQENCIRFVLLLVEVLISARFQSTFMKQLVHPVLYFFSNKCCSSPQNETLNV